MSIQEPVYNCAIVRFVENWRRASDSAGTARWTPPLAHAAVHAADSDPPPAPLPPDRGGALELNAAAERAFDVFPGAVGELVHREIRAHLDFGFRFGDDASLVRRLARETLAAKPAG